MVFSLLVDPWFSVRAGDEIRQASIWNALDRDVHDIAEPPLTRLAILRLLIAVESWHGICLEEGFNLYGSPGFLQVEGMPESAARSPRSIISIEDGNGPALNPLPRSEVIDDAAIARALVTAFFCDRGGLKSRLPGVPISGQRPLLMGQLIAHHKGSDLADLVNRNVVEWGEFKPWWCRPVTFDEPFTGSMGQYLLWPWRRLQAFSGRGVAIAAGQKLTGMDTDPWAWGRASLKHLNGIENPAYDADLTGLVLVQASAIACWRCTAISEVSGV